MANLIERALRRAEYWPVVGPLATQALVSMGMPALRPVAEQIAAANVAWQEWQAEHLPPPPPGLESKDRSAEIEAQFRASMQQLAAARHASAEPARAEQAPVEQMPVEQTPVEQAPPADPDRWWESDAAFNALMAREQFDRDYEAAHAENAELDEEAPFVAPVWATVVDAVRSEAAEPQQAEREQAHENVQSREDNER